MVSTIVPLSLQPCDGARSSPTRREASPAPVSTIPIKEDLFAQAFINRTHKIHAGMVAVLEQDVDLRTRLIEALDYIISTADSGMIRLFEDFHRCVTPDVAARCEEQKVNPDALMSIYNATFEQAAGGGESLVLAPEQAARIFMCLQMGMLNMLHVMEQIPETAPERRQLATETVDTFLSGALVRT